EVFPPEDRGGVARPRQGDLPADVLLRPPGEREMRLRTDAGPIRPAPGRPVVGPTGTDQAGQGDGRGEDPAHETYLPARPSCGGPAQLSTTKAGRVLAGESGASGHDDASEGGVCKRPVGLAQRSSTPPGSRSARRRTRATSP